MQRFYSASTGGNYQEGVSPWIPDDAKPISEDLFLSLLGKEIETGPDGLPREKVAPPPSFEQRKVALLAAVDAHLNAAAKAKGYDSIINASLRAALPASPFHAEGVAFGTWMDAVYAKCYEVLGGVQSGQVEEPNEAQLIAMLPALQLPE